MDEQDEIFTSPDLPAELSTLSTWVENRERPTLRQRARVPVLMALVLLLEFGLIFLFEDFINRHPDKIEKDKKIVPSVEVDGWNINPITAKMLP